MTLSERNEAIEDLTDDLADGLTLLETQKPAVDAAFAALGTAIQENQDMTTIFSLYESCKGAYADFVTNRNTTMAGVKAIADHATAMLCE